MGILQARILEWVAIPFSRGSPQPKDRTQVYCTTGRFLTIWVTRETQSSPIFHHFLSSVGHQGQKLTQTGSSQRVLLKEDSCISSWSPGPVAGLWEVSRIAQPASGPLAEAARPASFCPAFHSRLITDWPSLLTRPSTPALDSFSWIVAPVLSLQDLLAWLPTAYWLSLSIHWFQNPRRENLICPYLNSCLTLVQSTMNDGSASPRGWTGHVL